MTMAPPKAHRGSVLLWILLFLTAITFIFSPLLVQQNILQDQDMARQLFRLRVHWAMRGHMDYMMSRIHALGTNLTDLTGDTDCLNGELNPVACVDDADKIKWFQKVWADLEDRTHDAGETVLQGISGGYGWFYPEASSHYKFAITWADTGIQDNSQYDSLAADNADDGRLRLALKIMNTPIPTIQVIKEMVDDFPQWQADFCVGSAPRLSRNLVGASCETDGDRRTTNGIITIERLGWVQR